MARKKATSEQSGTYETRGKERFYEEIKKDLTLAITPTGAEQLKEKAALLGLTRSEFVERIARGMIPLDLEPAMLGESSAS